MNINANERLAFAAESGPDEPTLLREFYGNWVRFHRMRNQQARLLKAEEALPESYRTKLDLEALTYLAQKMVEQHHAIEEARAQKGIASQGSINDE